MKQRSTKMYRSRVTLRIHSLDQLLDTLRYESMVPDAQADVSVLSSLNGRPSSLGVNVSFRRYAMNPGPPNEERLRSFNIHLVSWEPVE